MKNEGARNEESLDPKLVLLYTFLYIKHKGSVS